MGANDFKLNKVPFSLKNQGISMFHCLLPRNLLLCKQGIITALLTAHTTIYVPSLIRIERGSDGGP